MGPRSDNRGYELCIPAERTPPVVASMGPRSDNRGYGAEDMDKLLIEVRLQWVHGRITVVMPRVCKSGLLCGLPPCLRAVAVGSQPSAGGDGGPWQLLLRRLALRTRE